MDRLAQLEDELNSLAGRRSLFPRSWAEEIARRVAETGFEIEDIVLELKEESGFIATGPATLESLIECERRYLALFEPDELLPEPAEVPTRSSAD